MTRHPVYRERLSGRTVNAIGHTKVLKSSDGREWDGVQIDVARSRGWHVDDLMVDGHLLAFNLADRPLHYLTRNETDWVSVSLPPMGFWINPEGRPFSIEHDENSYYASIFVNGSYLDEVAGRHFELKAGNGVTDNVLATLAQSIIGLLFDERSYCQELCTQVNRAFVYALATRHGHAASAYVKGGIAPAQLKSLMAWIENNLQEAITVREMAARVGLSAAHFSREFKRSTGHTPWEYVIQLRLEGARRLLEAGTPSSEAALRYGFSDQAHLSRLFKHKYGMTPSSFVKTHRGWYAA